MLAPNILIDAAINNVLALINNVPNASSSNAALLNYQISPSTISDSSKNRKRNYRIQMIKLNHLARNRLVNVRFTEPHRIPSWIIFNCFIRNNHCFM
jgi:hypothetical protein